MYNKLIEIGTIESAEKLRGLLAPFNIHIHIPSTVNKYSHNIHSSRYFGIVRSRMGFYEKEIMDRYDAVELVPGFAEFTNHYKYPYFAKVGSACSHSNNLLFRVVVGKNGPNTYALTQDSKIVAAWAKEERLPPHAKTNPDDVMPLTFTLPYLAAESTPITDAVAHITAEAAPITSEIELIKLNIGI